MVVFICRINVKVDLYAGKYENLVLAFNSTTIAII